MATRGPWATKAFDEAQTIIVGPEYDGGKRELVAIVSVGKHAPNGESNAELIARAPELRDDVERLCALLAAAREGIQVAIDNLSPAPDSWLETVIEELDATLHATGGPIE